MGTYLNPRNDNFLEMVNTGRYVDKTMLIEQTNKRLFDPTFKFNCISRPRRFGKSIAGDMLVAYYSKGADSKELFSQYKIAKTADFEKYLNKFNVIYIDLNAMNSNWQSCYPKEKKETTVIDYVTNRVCDDFRKQFSDIDFGEYNSIADFIQTVHEQKNEKFIIIIDEYDVLIREQVSEQELDLYRSFLISLFKNANIKTAIALAYLTGILPIMKDKIQSKLNTFRPYNMISPNGFAEFVGFTSEEVSDLCKKYDCDLTLCKSWYDGYHLENFDVYNPESVMNALVTKTFDSYWSGTSTYLVVADKINMNYEGTKDDVIAMLSGGSVSVDVEHYDNTFSNILDKDDVFTFLIHLGYLAYDKKTRKCYIPNREVNGEWQKAIKNNYDYAVTNKIIQDSENLLNATLAGDSETVAAALDKSHIHVTSNLSYNNEKSLQSAIYLAYIYALNNYTIIKEMPTGKGYADIVYIPFDKTQAALIVELKRNSSPETALAQIKEKQYFECLSTWQGDILFVGVNYDETTKKHECKIEKFVKN
jgi:hypothetical protein